MLKLDSDQCQSMGSATIEVSSEDVVVCLTMTWSSSIVRQHQSAEDVTSRMQILRRSFVMSMYQSIS